MKVMATDRMSYVTSAHLAVWKPIMAAVMETIGSETQIFRAAVSAGLGRDKGGEKFLALFAQLPMRDQDRLWKSVRRHRGKAGPQLEHGQPIRF